MSDFTRSRLGSRDLNRDSYYVPLNVEGTAAARGGGSPGFSLPVGRISRTNYTPIVQGAWEQIPDLITVERTQNVTLTTTSITIDEGGWYIIGAEIELQGPINDFDLAYRVLAEGTELLSEKFRVQKANVSQIEFSRAEFFVPGGCELTLEIFTGISGYTLDYAAIYAFMTASTSVSGGGGGPASGITFDDSNCDFIALTVQTAIEENCSDIGEVRNAQTSLPYFSVNSSGSSSSASGANGISIGQASDASSTDSISIGRDSGSFNAGAIAIGNNAISEDGIVIGIDSTTTNGGNLAIGNQCFADGSNSMVIGEGSSVDGYSNALAFGFNATAEADNVVAIGSNSNARSLNSIAIGSSANVSITADNSVQIGAGTNSTSDTLQFLSSTIADNNGLITNHSATNYIAGDSNIDTHLSGIDTVLSNALNSPYFIINHDGTLPNISGDDILAIGESTTTDGNNAIAIGRFARAGSSGTAVGHIAQSFADSATAIGGSTNAIGTSSTAIGAGAASPGNTSVAIGAATQSIGISSVAIGNASFTTEDGAVAVGNGTQNQMPNAITVGNNSSVASPLGGATAGIAIGNSASVDANGDRAIAIGDSSSVTTLGVAIGFNAQTSATGCISIGTAANATATSAVQIGSGTNTDSSTMQFLGNRIANAEGLYTGHTGVNYTPTDADNVDSHLEAIDNALANSGGDPYIDLNITNPAVPLPISTGLNSTAIGGNTTADNQNCIALGTSSQATNVNAIALGIDAVSTGLSSLCVGRNSDATGDRSVSIGDFARATNTESISIGNNSEASGEFSISLGTSAVANANNSAQLGTGTNSTANTLQFLTNTIANADGSIIPLQGAFADDAAAGVGGVTTGQYYQTDGTGAAPLNVAGILMIKQ